MIRVRRTLAGLWKDKSGISMVELGLIAGPFCMIMLGLLDLTYQMYVHSVLQGAANDAARRITVESPNLGTSGSLENRIKQVVENRMGAIDLDGVTYTVTAESYYRFADHGRAERLTLDANSNNVADPGDCWIDSNPNNQHDPSAGAGGTGNADDIVQISIRMQMPRLMPLNTLFGYPSQYDMTVRSATKRQPFRDQAVPPQRCRPTT